MFQKILSGFGLMERAIDSSVLRQDAISQNIANVDTPGYTRKNVFENVLDEVSGGLVGKRTNVDIFLSVNLIMQMQI